MVIQKYTECERKGETLFSEVNFLNIKCLRTHFLDESVFFLARYVLEQYRGITGHLKHNRRPVSLPDQIPA